MEGVHRTRSLIDKTNGHQKLTTAGRLGHIRRMQDILDAAKADRVANETRPLQDGGGEEPVQIRAERMMLAAQ